MLTLDLNPVPGSPHAKNSMVESVFFTASVCDSIVISSASGVQVSLAHQCDSCNASFASQRSLLLHKQSFHGRRSSMRFYAGADGVCPACGVVLHTGLRLLKHLSDRRRPRCRQQALETVIPLANDVVEKLDADDPAARRAAKAQGFGFVASSSQATRADGKLAGCCRY